MNLRGLKKEVQAVVRDAAADGWKASLTASGHIKLELPGLSPVFMSRTPSDPRSLKNARSELRRRMRGAV